MGDVRVRTRRRKQGSDPSKSPWFDAQLSLLTPTPLQRRDWGRVRSLVWEMWAELDPEERPPGNEFAPQAAIVIDWNWHLGPTPLTEETLDEYEALAGNGFQETRKILEEHLA